LPCVLARAGLDESTAERRRRRLWQFAVFVAFIPTVAWTVYTVISEPLVLGSHAESYRDAAAAMVAGNDPWKVGPPGGIFAGPPTMLLPLVPFVGMPELPVRAIWVIGDLLVAAWALRRLQLPWYWLAFPPLFQSIVLGHPEVLVLALLTLRSPIAGFAALLKPYAVFPLVAERRWRAILVAVVVGAGSLIVLPWELFALDASRIAANLARQAYGTDSVFGQPFLMALAVIALGSLGLRRGLWLAVPVLWPYAQLNYRTMTVPMLSPIVAIAWSVPLPGATLAGVLIDAGLRLLARLRPLPPWLNAGLAVPDIPSGRGPTSAARGRQDRV